MITSAPGKIMLFGEYAVLEGHECLVVAIDRSVCTHYTPANTIAVNAPSYGRHEPENNLKELPFIAAVLDNNPTIRGDFRISSRGFKAKNGKLGLGSSAASTVSFSAALQVLTTGKIHHLDLMASAQNAHFSVQGLGSGADIAASCFGGALRYAWRPPGVHGRVFAREVETEHGRACVESVDGGLQEIMAVWTGHSASTTALVTAVGKKAGTKTYQAVMESLSAAAVSGMDSWQACDRGGLMEAMVQSTAALERLGSAAGVNLVTESHRELSQFVGKRGAVKPTGAGGGDLAWVLGRDSAVDVKLCVELRRAGYECLLLNVDRAGAKLLP